MELSNPVSVARAQYCSDWETKMLGDRSLARINSDTLTEKCDSDLEFDYIDISSVSHGTVDYSSVETTTFSKAPSRARRRLMAGDTAICTVRPLLGSHFFVSEISGRPKVCSTGFAVIRPGKRLQPEFLRCLPFTEPLARQLVALQCGTNYPAVNERDVERLWIPVPSLDEQQGIARILDAIDSLIAKISRSSDAAFNVKKSLYQHLFRYGTRKQSTEKTVLGSLPASWQVKAVGDVTSTLQYGLSVAMDSEGVLPILRMGNIQEGNVVMSALKYVSLSERMTNPFLLIRGDVLFNRVNSQELVGKVGIYRHDAPCVFASYLIRVHADPEHIDNYYLGHVLNSYEAQCRIKRYATPGVQQVNINATNLGKVLIPVPIGANGLAEQREIASVLEKAEDQVHAFKPMRKAAEDLKRTLANDLLTGKVRVNDVNLNRLVTG